MLYAWCVRACVRVCADQTSSRSRHAKFTSGPHLPLSSSPLQRSLRDFPQISIERKRARPRRWCKIFIIEIEYDKSICHCACQRNKRNGTFRVLQECLARSKPITWRLETFLSVILGFAEKLSLIKCLRSRRRSPTNFFSVYRRASEIDEIDTRPEAVRYYFPRASTALTARYVTIRSALSRSVRTYLRARASCTVRLRSRRESRANPVAHTNVRTEGKMSRRGESRARSAPFLLASAKALVFTTFQDYY